MKNNTINILCNYASIYAGNFIPSILVIAKRVKIGNNVIFTFPVSAKKRHWINEFYKLGILVYFAHFDSKEFKRELKKINKLNDVNIVYSHFNSGFRIKSIYPFSKKVKLFIHVHSDFYGGNKIPLRARLKSWIEHRFVRCDASYIYVSEYMWKKFSKYPNHFYVRNALCLDRINDSDANTSIHADISKNDTIFLFYGWMPFIKGLDFVVKSFVDANLSDQNKLIVVNRRDGGYEESISYLSKTLKEKKYIDCKNIIFMDPAKDSFGLYKLADVFISASRSEGFSYSILESLYFNLRIISSDIEGVQWAKKYDNVFFFDVENVNALTQLLKSSENYKKRECLNKYIAREYDILEWCDKVIKILNLY